MDKADEEKSVSVQITVQRTKVEYGFVSVLISEDLLDDDGQLDTDKLLSASVTAANNPNMQWHDEDMSYGVNPMQKVRENEASLLVDSDGRDVSVTEQ